MCKTCRKHACLVSRLWNVLTRTTFFIRHIITLQYVLIGKVCYLIHKITHKVFVKTYHLPLSIIKQLYVERTSTREALGLQCFGNVYP